jgi:hypothetical protein
MRKSELKVGGEYAAGSTSSYDRFSLARVRVVDLDGEREEKTSWGRVQKVRGIVVALMGDSDMYRFRGKDGKEFVLKSAHDIQSEWAPYVERKAEHERIVAERQAEAKRVRKVAEEVDARLTALGFGRIVGGGSGVFRVPADTMAKIVAMIPDGR